MASEKVVVVGAGAIGNYFALKLCEFGIKPLILEEHKKVGFPVQCTGLVSTNINKVIDLPKDIVLNRIRGAKFFSKNEELVIGGKKPRAFVVDRAKYDKHLYSLASESGAQYRLNCRYLGHRVDEKYIEIKTPEALIKADLLVGADGPNSEVAACTGLRNNCISAVQYVCRLKREPEFVELYLGSKYSNHFFAWVVPESEKRARVGLAGGGRDLKRFSKDLGVGKIYSVQAGLIPIGYNRVTSGERTLLVGDAASHVKATSGGGIVYGSICAEIAAKSVKAAFERGNFSKRFLRENYDVMWQKLYGGQLKKHLLIREFLNLLSDAEYDWLLKFAREKKKYIEREGDMEFIARFISRLISPKLLLFMMRKTPFFFRNLDLLF